MNLYTIFFIYNIVMTVFSKNIDIKSGLEMPVPWSIGLRFFAEVQNNAGEDYSVEVHPERCCLDSNDSKCNIVKIMGNANDIISGGTSKTLTMVAPLLDPYKRKGICTLYVDSGPVARPKNVKRDTIKIKFNTKIKKNVVSNEIKACKHIDEDPMNDCKPVNCDIYYNGMRSHFSKLKKRCTAIPICTSPNSKVPNLAYNPTSNKCVHEPGVLKQDINYIKELTKNENQRMPKHVTIISVTDASSSIILDNKLSGNGTERGKESIRENLVADGELNDSKSKKKKSKGRSKVKAKTIGGLASNYSYSKMFVTNSEMDNVDFMKPVTPSNTLPNRATVFNRVFKYCINNKYALVFLTGVVFMQCCLICTLLYCITKTCCCFKKKHVVNKFFQDKQDISVTTPLIGTSNVDTDTTDYQYLSESSNYIDKKIKCYKACQKERKNNAKLSMSDDILSKCITRRDWHRIPPRSETIPEINNDDDEPSEEMKVASNNQKKVKDMKVNFQEEYQDKQTKHIKSIVKKDSRSKQDRLSDSSEQEIRCHSYNYNNCNITELKKHSNIMRNKGPFNHDNKRASGAQVYFSNDSIDDFLSERGAMFIGDNVSRYSFTSVSSAAKSTVSSQSSKTSKNNIVKNVMTLLSRKGKGPSSDPGIKKGSNLDLELLHLSRQTVYSSSNETDAGREMKRNKESTSSL